MNPKSGELRICGLAAVRARFQRDAASIRRLYFDYGTGRKIGVMCRALAAARRIYRCVEPPELERISGTVHHGGIVAIVPDVPPAPVGAGEPAAWAKKGEPLVVLDRIGNAHNLGAIARTAAFFGVPRLVICDDASAARPGDAAYRVAEGGMEALEVRIVPALPAFLRDLAAAGYEVAGAAAHGGRDENGLSLPPLAAVVVGSEEHGLSPEVAAACTRLVTIRGKGAVESLNVSAAAAILMWRLTGKRR